MHDAVEMVFLVLVMLGSIVLFLLSRLLGRLLGLLALVVCLLYYLFQLKVL